jgi:hypothetical protein
MMGRAVYVVGEMGRYGNRSWSSYHAAKERRLRGLNVRDQ